MLQATCMHKAAGMVMSAASPGFLPSMRSRPDSSKGKPGHPPGAPARCRHCTILLPVGGGAQPDTQSLLSSSSSSSSRSRSSSGDSQIHSMPPPGGPQGALVLKGCRCLSKLSSC
mmetsp:Transcript_14296/g.38038  ORF Transcript_14296/g.38038 Transcript_14296/m.38038 type:complete len:115 (+) Transcript_14296:119-463(+)